MSDDAAQSAMTVANNFTRTVAITCALVVALLAAMAAFPGPRWAQHVPGSVRAIYLTLVVVAAIWLVNRAWRTQVRFDDQGITIRRILRTQHFAWPEVSHFADGSVSYADGPTWVPVIVLRDGRAITLRQWAFGGYQAPDPDIPAAVAARYGIPAKLSYLP
jgi:Bacterial PH domain